MATIYNPGIPTGQINLDQDYRNLQNNFSQLDISFGSDHIPFSVNPVSPVLTGYHTVIHQGPAPSNVDPNKITGIGQTYVKTVNSDQQLFYISGGGSVSQMTGYSAAASGYQYLGGVILQWGFLPKTSLPPITFPIPFPKAVFSIQITSFQSPSTNKVTVGAQSVSKTGFSLFTAVPSDTGTYTGNYWIAIGN